MGHPTPPAWYVISLRPQGGHATLRHAARRHGAGLLALSPWRIVPNDDAGVRAGLQTALSAERVLFTSPAAVIAAQRLQALRAAPGQTWLAVGSGTAAALRRAGIPEVGAPTRMDSEGLLALPALQDVAGVRIGFVTAPDGRNLLAPALEQRGARLHRAEVYRRELLPLPGRTVRQLASLKVPACLLLSSGGALDHVLSQLPDDITDALKRSVVVAASARLAESARNSGFQHVVQAEGPRPAQMMNAAATAMAARIR